MAITHPHNDITDYAGHRGNVKIYADLTSNTVIFEGENINIDPMPIGSLAVTPILVTNQPRVKIARTDITTAGGAEYVIFKRRRTFRFFDKNGVRVTSGTDEQTQLDQLVAYLEAEFSKTMPAAIDNSAFIQYDVYADASYDGTNGVSDGTSMKPFTSIQAAVDAASDNDQLFLKGDFVVTSPVTLPEDKSLHFFGTDITQWCYASYDASNGHVVDQPSSSSTAKYSFNRIRFINAGGYGMYIRSAGKVTIKDCEFLRCGWSGNRLSTTAAGTDTWGNGGTLGYDSTQADLQSFWASTETSNGGAMRIRSTPVVDITDNTVHTNLRGLRIQDCGVGGNGIIARNRCYNNVESGIYLAAGSYTATDGCENFTVYNNFSANNSNNGILVIGGSNNIVSLNRVEGNWNAGCMLWHTSDTRARDMDLDNNNRSEFNGIGNTGDAAASFQIAGSTIRADHTFLAEVLDTTVHNTGSGSATTKNGLLITDMPTSDRPLVNIDDVAFINQDYGVVCDGDAVSAGVSRTDIDTYRGLPHRAVAARELEVMGPLSVVGDL